MADSYAKLRFEEMIVKSFGGEHPEDEVELGERITAEMKTRIEEIKLEAKETAKTLDDHVIYVCAGALAVLSQIFISDKFADLQGKTWLLFVFVILCVSLISIISSYIAYSLMLTFAHKTMLPQEEFLALSQKMGTESAKAGLDMEAFLTNIKANTLEKYSAVFKVFSAMKEIWETVRVNLFWNELFERMAKLLTFGSFGLFIIGMICFLMFGVTNFLN